jgi:hypothetical protein
MSEAIVAQFDLPSVRDWVRRISTELVGGRTVVVLVPHSIPTDAVRDQIIDDLGRKRVDDLDHITVENGGTTPEEQLCESFCKSCCNLPAAAQVSRLQESRRNYFAVADDHNLPGILFLDGLDDRTPSTQQSWAAFLDRWQLASKANREPPQRPCCFCIVADASRLKCLLTDDVWLTAVHWWNVPSELELQLLYRSMTSDPGACLSFEQRWRGALLPVLAGGDAGLLAQLMVDAPTTSAQVKPILKEYSKTRGWLDLADGGMSRHFSRIIPGADDTLSVSPPDRFLGLWELGVLTCSPERGVQVHPAYLCARDEKWLEFFDWQAQQSSLFGFMEQARFAVCRDITDSLGDGWALDTTPEDPNEERRVRRSSVHCSWGHLNTSFKATARLSRYLDWVLPSRLAPDVRNKLAHAEVAPLYEVKEFLSAVTKIVRHANGNSTGDQSKVNRS